MAEKTTTGLGFEQKIWDAACVLRGNMDAAEYKHVILGLIFLKYISDRFMERYAALVAEGEGYENDKDEYTAEGIFFVPEEARWDTIANNAHTPEIGLIIDNAMRAIESENRRLKNCLPIVYGRPELDKRKLGNVVDLFTNISMVDSGDEKDILGRTYEYCLARFAEQEGTLAGQFFTPSCVVRTLVEVLEPTHGRVYDPCCGSGGMFVQSTKFIEAHQGNINQISVYGQESNPTTLKLAQMNLAIRGIEADLGGVYMDTFDTDLHPTLRADFILANPPFNLTPWWDDKLAGDPRWAFGIPPEGNANYAWIQHMIHHLSPEGKIGLVLANGSLSSTTSGEDTIRENILKADLVECIVALPEKLFYTTTIPACLWFINKDKKQKGQTLFIDARKLGVMKTSNLRELSEADIQKIADTVHAFQNGELKEEIGFSAVASQEEIEKKKCILTPSLYVKLAETIGDEEPFEEKMIRLKVELAELFAEDERKKKKIADVLSSVGFEL